MTRSDLERIEAKANLVGVNSLKLGDLGLVISKSDTLDLMYLTSRNKAIEIKKERYIPEYYNCSGIVLIRNAVKTFSGYYKVEIRLLFPHNNKSIVFEEIEYINEFIYDGSSLPSRRFRISAEPESDALILSFINSKQSLGGGNRTYIISNNGHRKQVSSKYISVVNSGVDGEYNKVFVLLQIGRNGKPFRDIISTDELNRYDKEYAENNFINSIFTRYKLLSPSNKIIERR